MLQLHTSTEMPAGMNTPQTGMNTAQAGMNMPQTGMELQLSPAAMNVPQGTISSAIGMPAAAMSTMPAANAAAQIPQRPSHMMLQREEGAYEEDPSNRREVTESSVKGLLARNLGYYIVASFLMGTQRAIQWEGILASVGNDYLVIYQPDQNRYVSADIYALKFVEFHESQNPCAGYRRKDAFQGW